MRHHFQDDERGLRRERAVLGPRLRHAAAEPHAGTSGSGGMPSMLQPSSIPPMSRRAEAEDDGRSSTACPSRAGRRALEPCAAGSVPAAQAAALAATGFVAGAATVAVVAPPARAPSRRRRRKEGRDGRDRRRATRSSSTSTSSGGIDRRAGGPPGAAVRRRGRAARRGAAAVAVPAARRLAGRPAAPARRGAAAPAAPDGAPVHVGVVQPRPDRVLFGRAPRSEAAAHVGHRGGCASPPASTTTCARSTSASATTR